MNVFRISHREVNVIRGKASEVTECVCVCAVYVDTCFCTGHHSGGLRVGGADCLGPGAPALTHTQTPTVSPAASLGE